MRPFVVLCSFLFFSFCHLQAQSPEVPFTLYTLNCALKKAPVSKNNKTKRPDPSFVIKNKADLARLTECKDDSLFDFDNYILVGVEGSAGGCQVPQVSFQVLNDTLQKKYRVLVTVQRKGACRGVFAYKSFVKVQKPAVDYQVEIKTLMTEAPQ